MTEILTQIEKFYEAQAKLNELLKDPSTPHLQLAHDEVYTSNNIEDLHKMATEAGKMPTKIKARKRHSKYYPYYLGFSYCTKAGTTIKFCAICSEAEAKQYEADDET